LKASFAEYCGNRRCYLLAYADDIHLFGPADACIRFMQQDFSPLREFGISFVPAKFKLIGPNVPTIEEFSTSKLGAIMLGVPCGTSQFIRDQSAKEMEAYLQNLSTTLLLDAQSALLLVQYCFNRRPGYMSRVVEKGEADAAFENFDKRITDTLLRISGCRVDDVLPLPVPPAWTRADVLRALPERCGGLGIPKHCSAVRDYGMVNSRKVYDSFVQEHFEEMHRPNQYALTPWEAWVRLMEQQPADDRHRTLDLSTPKKALFSRHECLKRELYNGLNIPQRFIVESSSYPNSARWVKWTGGMRQRFSWLQEPYKHAIRSRLLQLKPLTACHCQVATPTVSHGLDCDLNRGLMTHRHNLVRDIVADFMVGMLGAAAVDREPEVPQAPGVPIKKADVAIQRGGTTMFIDVTVVNIAAPTYARVNAFATRRAEKLAEYNQMLPNAGTVFPLVVSATGMVDDDSLKLLDSFLRVDNTTKHYLKSLCLAEINAVTHQCGSVMMLAAESQVVMV
jgi:hypothetical protein